MAVVRRAENPVKRSATLASPAALDALVARETSGAIQTSGGIVQRQDYENVPPVPNLEANTLSAGPGIRRENRVPSSVQPQPVTL